MMRWIAGVLWCLTGAVPVAGAQTRVGRSARCGWWWDLDAIDFIPDPTTPQAFDKTLRTMLVTFEQVAKAVGLK